LRVSGERVEEADERIRCMRVLGGRPFGGYQARPVKSAEPEAERHHTNSHRFDDLAIQHR
jgi:hypothetical protein